MEKRYPTKEQMNTLKKLGDMCCIDVDDDIDLQHYEWLMDHCIWKVGYLNLIRDLTIEL